MSGRTSASHPLQIADLEAGGGRLGLTLCPGKKQPDAATGAWDRDLAADLRAIRDRGATALVSALTPDEMMALRVPFLGERAEEMGLDWYPLPIPDGGVPDPRIEAVWIYTALRLRRLLAGGGGAVIHCKGGLGRTGMLAADLLALLGEEPASAMARVRAARPGAVETALQEAWLGECRRRHAPLLEPDGRTDRLYAALLGGALGDGFGFPVEFLGRADILERHGPRGLLEPVFHGGRLLVTDDTQMTLFTAEGLLRAVARFEDRGICSVPAVVWFAYQRWLETQGMAADMPVDRGWLVDEPALRHQRAPGSTCIAGLQRPLPEDDRPAPNDSKGCGGVMRIAPVGLLAGHSADPEAFGKACALAALTHGHPSGILSAGALAAILGGLLAGDGIEEAATGALGLLAERRDGAETVRRIEQALDLAADDEVAAETALARLGEGWVGEEALAVALFAALRGGDLRGVVRLAANHDGDSDSTASLAGQIHGARHGLADLPQSWVRRLDVLEPLLLLAHDLAVTTTGRGRWLASYPPS